MAIYGNVIYIWIKVKAMKTLPPEPEERADYHTPALDRALSIMELLAGQPTGLGLSEIAEALDLPKNSVFRITMTLASRGYLVRDDDSRRFRLSRKLLALGYRAAGEPNLLENARDVMRELRDMTRETVLLATLLDAEGVVLDQVLGLHPFKFVVDPGTRFQLHTSAPGKAMLAWLPAAEQERMLSRIRLTRFNRRTITTREGLLAEFGRVRELGYATDRAEEIDGVHCVGAPVFSHDGRPIAAIWTTGPCDRLPEARFDEIGRMVAGHARRISGRFGYDLVG